MKNILNQEKIKELQQMLLGWFEENQRFFPWRESRNPYHIMIAEKLLQQTSAGGRIVTAYLAIMNKFPDSQSLSNANLCELKSIVAPLGLHYRAEELLQLARAVQSEYQGKIPKDIKELLALPGIGEYTARAILSFAYEEDVAIIDTNVARFLFRVFGLELPMPANPARKRVLIDLATSILPSGNSRDFNLAILDLCAAICKPKVPYCEKCPVQLVCFFGSNERNNAQPKPRSK